MIYIIHYVTQHPLNHNIKQNNLNFEMKIINKLNEKSVLF